jgi:hypothetical protein
MAAALYGARAGLRPLVIAPTMGGQLLAKGVDVENYPGVHNSTGPGLVSLMRKQAAHFGAVFEDDVVASIDASRRPFRIATNATGVIEAHSVIVCTGAEAKWLGVKGEYDLRGGGVSSCATCDGFLFSGQDVVVVGCVQMRCFFRCGHWFCTVLTCTRVLLLFWFVTSAVEMPPWRMLWCWRARAGKSRWCTGVKAFAPPRCWPIACCGTLPSRWFGTPGFRK